VVGVCGPNSVFGENGAGGRGWWGRGVHIQGAFGRGLGRGPRGPGQPPPSVRGLVQNGPPSGGNGHRGVNGGKGGRQKPTWPDFHTTCGGDHGGIHVRGGGAGQGGGMGSVRLDKKLISGSGVGGGGLGPRGGPRPPGGGAGWGRADGVQGPGGGPAFDIHGGGTGPGMVVFDGAAHLGGNQMGKNQGRAWGWGPVVSVLPTVGGGGAPTWNNGALSRGGPPSVPFPRGFPHFGGPGAGASAGNSHKNPSTRRGAPPAGRCKSGRGFSRRGGGGGRDRPPPLMGVRPQTAGGGAGGQ